VQWLTRVRVEGGSPTVELSTPAGRLVARQDSLAVETPVGRRGRGAGGFGGGGGGDRWGSATLGVGSGRQLRYAMRAHGVKENLVLSSAVAGSSFDVTFSLPAGVTARQGVDGVEFVDGSGSVVAQYLGGLAVDATAAAADDVAPAGTTTMVVVTLAAVSDGSATVRYGVDAGWLRAPTRSFPVTLDPDLTLYSSDPYTDLYLNSDNPYGTAPGGGPEAGIPYYAQSHLRVGNKTAPGWRGSSCRSRRRRRRRAITTAARPG